MSGAARQALAQSHTMTARLDVLHGGKVAYTLVPHSGSVNTAAGRTVMRNLSATVIDPTGRLGGGDVNDLLSPYDCEVQPWRAVKTPAGFEWAPLGVFGLTGRQVVGDGQVQLTGQDRAMKYQGGMTGQVAINAGTPVETAISSLLVTRNPGLTSLNWATGYKVGPLLYAADIDVWAEAQKLAQSVGGWLYHDRVGELRFAPLRPSSTKIVARYSEGGGVLLGVNRKEDSDNIHNVVVVQNTNNQSSSSGGNTGTVITATAEDLDPTSPTYARGKYGRRVLVITNQNVTSQQQAQQAAATRLVLELGRTETVSALIVCDPGLDVLDLAVVNRPAAGLVERTLCIQQTDCPLTAGDAMGLGFRNYILTRDGQTMDTAVTVNG